MSDELVTIATFFTATNAALMRGFLEANGIEVFMADENVTRIAGHLAPAIGGIKLQVRGSDAETARLLLAQVESH